MPEETIKPGFKEPINLTGERQISVVECIVCHQIHRSDSKAFFTIQGNILIGTDAGIVGNNFVVVEGQQILRNVTTYCRQCFIRLIEDAGVNGAKFGGYRSHR